MERKRALESGANDYVTKPFSPQDLISEWKPYAELLVVEGVSHEGRYSSNGVVDERLARYGGVCRAP